MNATLARTTLVWLLLLVYASASVVGGRGFVLCFDPDGHIALEASSGSDCNGCANDDSIGAKGRGVASHDAALSTAPACPCSDVPLPTVDVAKKQAIGGAIEVPRVAVSVTQITWPVTLARPPMTGCAERSAAANRAPRTRVRSAVLLV